MYGKHVITIRVLPHGDAKMTLTAAIVYISQWLEVFTQRNFVADFIRFNLNCIHKNDKFAFWAPFAGVIGNMRILSIAGWNARGRLPIRDN